MATKQKTYSIVQAMRVTGYSRAMISRLCQRGVVGTRHQFGVSDYHMYSLSAQDIAQLKARKKQTLRNG